MRGAIAAVVLLSSMTAGTGAIAGKSTLAAATVEATESAELIRLVVSPATSSSEPEVVCGDDSIRVRLDSVAARSEGLEELDVPAGGPMRRVRIAPRLGGGAVVQIHTTSRPLAACSRTTAMRFGSEIVVSMALTSSEKARFTARKAAQALAAKSASAEEETNAKTEPPVAEKPAEEKAVEEKAVEEKPVEEKPEAAAPVAAKTIADESPEKAAAGVGFGIKEPSKPLPVAQGGNGPGGLRYALGFVFAVAIAGLAFWTKRHKKKKRTDELTDDIDIISTKRLSAHQQLIVAQVQGTKFLLAVSDKAVTNLGAVPSARSDFAQREAPTDAFSLEGVLTPPRPSLDVAREDARSAERSFRGELDSAIDRAKGTPYAAIPSAPRGAEPQSNVAGLISMARMRANMRDSRRGPIAEA